MLRCQCRNNNPQGHINFGSHPLVSSPVKSVWIVEIVVIVNDLRDVGDLRSSIDRRCESTWGVVRAGHPGQLFEREGPPANSVVQGNRQAAVQSGRSDDQVRTTNHSARQSLRRRSAGLTAASFGKRSEDLRIGRLADHDGSSG